MKKAIGLALLPLGVLVAACSSTSSSGSYSTATTAAGNATSTPITLSLLKTKSYGEVLGSSTGQVYYMLTADSSNKSTCYSACATAWPPVQATTKVAAGVSSSLVSKITRTGGSSQLEYAGHPLYTFSSDVSQNATNGEGVYAFGGYWYVLSASGQPIKTAVSTSPSTTAASYY
ncbi:MAG: hypothetical protein HKL83_03710 [Acidimicrobiaceae bacterium]|nr:hypothetical protein [Acidimicrobiaceae bacterium]